MRGIGTGARPAPSFPAPERARARRADAACEIGHAVEGARLVRRVVPREGQTLRPLVADADLTQAFAWPLGTRLAFDVDGATEQLETRLTLLGQRILASLDREASLPYDVSALGFVAYDATGAESSVVHLLRVALPRVPFDVAEELTFTDLVPHAPRSLRRIVGDFRGVAMEYRVERRPHGGLVITGASRDRALVTRVELDGSGPRTIEVARGTRVRTARRITVPHAGATERADARVIERRRGSWLGGRT